MDFLKVSWMIEKQKKEKNTPWTTCPNWPSFLPMETSQFKQVTLETAATKFESASPFLSLSMTSVCECLHQSYV